MFVRLAYILAAAALSASALLVLYGTWLHIIQKPNKLGELAAKFLIVGLLCLAVGFVTAALKRAS